MVSASALRVKRGRMQLNFCTGPDLVSKIEKGFVRGLTRMTAGHQIFDYHQILIAWFKPSFSNCKWIFLGVQKGT
eukprot:g4244.t1